MGIAAPGCRSAASNVPLSFSAFYRARKTAINKRLTRTMYCLCLTHNGENTGT